MYVPRGYLTFPSLGEAARAGFLPESAVPERNCERTPWGYVVRRKTAAGFARGLVVCDREAYLKC